MRNVQKIFLIFLIFDHFVPVGAVTMPQEIILSIQSDGITRVDYQFKTEVTSLETNISLINEIYQDLFIINEGGLPLEFEEFSDYITVFSLGSNLVNVSYITSELTSKISIIWSLNITIPISAKIVLPLDATIINLNTLPLEIKTEKGKTMLIMPSGNVDIQYTLEILDSESLAEETLQSAEDTIQTAKNNGVIVPEAESLFTEARVLFQQEYFLEAEEKAAQTIELVAEIVQKKALTEAKISASENAIKVAQESGKKLGLDDAEGFLLEAKYLFDAGEYDQALFSADKALEAALNAEKSANNTMLILIGFLVIVVTGAFLYMRKRVPVETIHEDVLIDIESIFDEHPELRLDDRKVLKYLAENDGKAFAYDIRERFDIPRTSAWRMIQRLQRYEVVDERKIGGQSLVQIKEKYRRKR